MVYLKLPGILGPVKSKGHIGWIELADVAFGHGWSLHQGQRSSPSDTREFHVSRRPDTATQDIASAFIEGRRFGEAWLEVSSVIKKERVGVLYTMNWMQIASYDMSGTDGKHLEWLTLSFEGTRKKSIGGAGPS